jgi:ABC-2 type transport system ATP-binding protein
MTAPLIASRGLARTFKTRTGKVEAVKGVDFTVSAGEIVGFLGPNGAGKTTTQRMLSTSSASSCPTWPSARTGRFRAGSAAGSTSRSAWSTSRR